MSSSKLYQFQEWLEGKVSAVLPEGVEVICRRKGNIDNDIQNALSTLGIAVVIEPPLPLAWSKTYTLKAETVESEVHILENVLLQNTQETAYSLLESLAKSLHEERCDELGGAVITLGSVRDESPADEPVLHFVLPLTNALNL
ncbi:MAG: hypothetical protein BHW65_06960 [Verrucomicrobia bacterium CAG:312_58_20]|nr:MAG: hypothetical protein BHW65_06960 [Verrucomicrobia bacterium CAG:312_58_20]